MSKRLSDAELEQRRRAPWRHGLRSEFAESGDPNTLPPAKRSEYAAILQELSEPGSEVTVLQELLAGAVLLVRDGDAALRAERERKGREAAFASTLMQRWIAVREHTRRCVVDLARLRGTDGDGGPDAGDVLEAVRGKRNEQGQ